MVEFITSILTAAVSRNPHPFATQGEIITERSGILNIGIEGMLLVGAMSGFVFSRITGSPWLGVVIAGLLTMLFSLIHGILTVCFWTQPSGKRLALNFLGIGLTSVLGSQFVGQTARGFDSVALGPLKNIPIIGQALFNQNALVYLSFVLTPLIAVFLYKTRTGLNIRAVGDSPVAADAARCP